MSTSCPQTAASSGSESQSDSWMATNFCSLAEKGVNDVGVEFCASAVRDDRLGFLMRIGVFVHARRGQHVVYVGQGHDEAAQRNVFAGKSRGIAGAVVMFVVRGRDVAGHAQVPRRRDLA